MTASKPRGRGRPPSRGRPAARSAAGPRQSGGPARRGLGGEQVEGRQAVRELLLAGRRRVKDVWIAEGVEETALVTEIRELAAEGRGAIRSVGRTRLDAAARPQAPQGGVGPAAPLQE